jgi:hypothetical protein|tara:strand:- start:318 stop:536 length:219 start_codon:yes stop_codon:yes gene_type:complete
MKRLLNNMRTWDDFLNTFLVAILYIFIKAVNGTAYAQYAYYKLRGIPCAIHTEGKFGDKYIVKDEDEDEAIS